MNHKVKVTVQLLDPKTGETIETVSAIREPKKSAVHPDGWPGICTAKEAYEAALRMVSDEKW